MVKSEILVEGLGCGVDHRVSRGNRGLVGGLMNYEIRETWLRRG